MIEIWLRDEYGQGTILGRYPEFSKAKSHAISHISAQNLDNALTHEERMKNWDCYLPVAILSDGSISDEIYFAGKKGGKIPYFIDSSGNEISVNEIKIMLGKNAKGGGDVFLQDIRKRLIGKLDDPALSNKAFVFFKHIK
jgi:hypothetical protein